MQMSETNFKANEEADNVCQDNHTRTSGSWHVIGPHES